MGLRQDLPTDRQDQSVGELMTDLSEQTSRLIRDEVSLAREDLKASIKHAVMGAGMFSTAGVLALYGVGVLLVAAIVALALVLPLWASALIVAGCLFIAAAVAALVGKSQVGQFSPTPQRAMDSVKRDVNEVKEASHHDR